MNLPQNINLCEAYTEDDIKGVRDGIIEFNSTDGPMLQYPPYEPSHLILKDDEGKLAGGLLSKIYLRCAFIEILWVDAKYRKSGLGSRLLAEIESIARGKRCTFVHLDTFSFQAIGFYKKYGYEVFAELKDYPGGIVRYFLKKGL